MASGQFRSSVWDPILIVSQMSTLQFLFYSSLGLWIIVTDFIIGSYKSLDQIFGYETLQIKDFHGRLIVISFVLNALSGALGLWYVVRRTKQCWDFAITAHIFHLIVCWIYNGAFPSTLTWWLVTLISVIIMTVLGEFLCMRTELKAIPLSGGPKADL